MRIDTNAGARSARRSWQQGFTLIELLVAIFISVAVIVGMLNLFDLSNRITVQQTEIAEMQQSHRVAQYDLVRLARETARGMVPVDHPDNPNGAITIPQGLAVAVRNNVGADENVVAGNPASPGVVEGSDVLTLRGIYSTPIYLIDYGNANAVTVVGNPATSGTVVIDQLFQGVLPQDFAPLQQAIASGDPEALFVVGPRSEASFSIVELDGAASSVTADQITLAFRITGCARCGDYQNLAPWPATGLRNIAYIGVLEEYQYYIQEQFRVAGDDTSPLMPRLARARFYPGTTTPHPSNPNMQVAIADNVFDLQTAFGIDSTLPLDGVVTEADPPDDADDWLYNSADDDETDTTKWVRELVGTELERKPLFYLRINTLVHTDRKFRLYFAEPLTTIEDRTYTAADFNDPEEQRYRRRWLQSVVDFRNLF